MRPFGSWSWIGVIVVVVVCVAAVLLWTPKRPPTSAPGDSAPSSVRSAPSPSSASDSPYRDADAASVLPRTDPPLGGEAPTASEAPEAGSAAAPGLDPENDETAELFLTDEEIAQRIAEKGLATAYLDASTAHREDFIDYLMNEDSLRDALAVLLPAETDSALRAFMLERVAPRGYYDDVTVDEHGGFGQPGDLDDPAMAASGVLDEDLMALLDASPSTPMDESEWVARLDLALMLDDAYGLLWARKARDEGPADPTLRMLASVVVLNLAPGNPTVEYDETRHAQLMIQRTLGADSVEADRRIRGYFALHFAPDRDQARNYLERRREIENDAQARVLLERILERWEYGGGN